jgi:hypothetical protein
MQKSPLAQRIYAVASTLGIVPADITSVRSGPHTGSAHGEGRALDVGAIHGGAVGFNKPTWDFIVGMILRGNVQAIGTIGELANNPQLKAFARQHGVDLFLDDKSTGATGNHVHVQVAA